MVFRTASSGYDEAFAGGSPCLRSVTFLASSEGIGDFLSYAFTVPHISDVHRLVPQPIPHAQSLIKHSSWTLQAGLQLYLAKNHGGSQKAALRVQVSDAFEAGLALPVKNIRSCKSVLLPHLWDKLLE